MFERASYRFPLVCCEKLACAEYLISDFHVFVVRLRSAVGHHGQASVGFLWWIIPNGL